MAQSNATIDWFHKKLIKSRHVDSDPSLCPAVNRIKIILEHFHEYMESSPDQHRARGTGMHAYICRTLKHYSVVKLMDDYHHIVRKYFNQLPLVHSILTSNIVYDIWTSVIFKRINRNRQDCSSNDIRCGYFLGYNASEEVSVQNLMDKIYCHLILSFDAGYMLTQNEILRIATAQIADLGVTDSITSASDDSFSDYAIDKPFKTIVDITRNKRKVLSKVRGSNRMKCNKFVSHRITNTNTEKEKENKENQNNDEYIMDFGVNFKYWKAYSSHKWYIAPKYCNLKSEMTRNALCGISSSQFSDEIKNAIAYIGCKRGRKLRCKYSSSLCSEMDIIGIASDTVISIDHMLSLMIFCSYDVLRKHVVSVYNSVRESHSEYCNICRLLYESIRLYGTDIAKYCGFQMTFYHCFSWVSYFSEFHAYFSIPTSTTSSLSVISTYCSEQNGLILQLKKDIEYCGDQHYMDCWWFSPFGVESEKLFSNIMLSFKAILYPDLYHNYAQYLNAFNALQSMIIATELNQDILTPLVPKFLKQMIFNRTNIPQYILSTFASFISRVKTIQINVWLMIIDSYEIMDDDDDDAIQSENQYGYLKLHSLFIANDGWIYIDRLVRLFPNTEHIQLFNGNIQTGEILPCITLDESTMNNLLNILQNETILNKISFYSPDESLLSIQSILNIFTKWFSQIQWNIKIAHLLPPFFPDKSNVVRTLVVYKL